MSEAQTAREQKHISLSGALNRVDDLNERIYTLKRRIEGSDQPDAPVAGRQIPSLKDVLEHGSGQINGTVDSAMAGLQEIEDLLY